MRLRENGRRHLSDFGGMDRRNALIQFAGGKRTRRISRRSRYVPRLVLRRRTGRGRRRRGSAVRMAHQNHVDRHGRQRGQQNPDEKAPKEVQPGSCLVVLHGDQFGRIVVFRLWFVRSGREERQRRRWRPAGRASFLGPPGGRRNLTGKTGRIMTPRGAAHFAARGRHLLWPRGRRNFLG